jgi:hypothetical protein
MQSRDLGIDVSTRHIRKRHEVLVFGLILIGSLSSHIEASSYTIRLYEMVHVVSYSIKREHTTVQPTNMLHLFKCIASPSRTTSSLPYRLTEYNI